MTSALFSPYKINGLELANRINVAPMCQYSASDGVIGDWHMTHLGMLANSGAGLVFVEMTAARRPHGDDLPGADDLAQSELHDRRADRRGAGAPSRLERARGAREGDRAAGPRRHSLSRAAHRRLSAQAVRRHAPARHDRDRARLRPGAADRRRADHRARRHDPGADPRPDARPEAHQRRGDHPDHARSRRGRRGVRRGRRDVCGRDRRARVRPRLCSRRRSIPTRSGCSPRSRGSICVPIGLPSSKACCPTWLRPRSAAASPTAARSCWRNAAPRRRRWSSSAGAGRAACGRRSKGSPHECAGRGRGAGEAFRRAPFGIRPAAQPCEGGRRRRLHGRGRKDAGAGRRVRVAASPRSGAWYCVWSTRPRGACVSTERTCSR